MFTAYFAGIAVMALGYGLYLLVRKVVPPSDETLIAVLTGRTRPYGAGWDTRAVDGNPLNCNRAVEYLLARRMLRVVPNMFSEWYEANDEGQVLLRELTSVKAMTE